MLGVGLIGAHDDADLLAACRVSFTISISMASPASTSSSSVMCLPLLLRAEAPSRASGGTWMNAVRRGPLSPAVASIAPAQIVAEITAGIARGPCIDAGAARCAQQFCGVRAKHHGVGVARDRSLVHRSMVGIGPDGGDGVAGAGFDPHARCPRSKPEQRQRLRLSLREELRQLAIDRCISHGKDVA